VTESTLLRAYRETQNLSDSRAVVQYFDLWLPSQRQEYRTAYLTGDWETVERMTYDLRGSQYWRNMVYRGLYDVIVEESDG
jgi:hypothetical protein